MFPRVRETLKAQERSQAWLARKIGVSPQYISAVMLGHLSMPPQWRPRIASALLVPESVLFVPDVSNVLDESTNDKELSRAAS